MIDTCTMNTSPHEASALLKKGITESGKYEIMISEGMRWSFFSKTMKSESEATQLRCCLHNAIS